MRTTRATLSGGPYCGLEIHPSQGATKLHISAGAIYVWTDRRDSENRQVFTYRPERETVDLPRQSDIC